MVWSSRSSGPVNPIHVIWLVISLVVADGPVAVIMAALAGGCIGFLPYNLNPAKIFRGDTGSTFLGFVLAVMSIQGLFKFYTIISFAVPLAIEKPNLLSGVAVCT